MKLLLFILRKRKEHWLVVPVPVRIERILVTGWDEHAVPIDAEHGILDFLRFIQSDNGLFGQEFRLDDKAVELSRQIFKIQRYKPVRFIAEEFAQLFYREIRAAQIFKRFAAEAGITEYVPRKRNRYKYLVKAVVFPVVMYGCESWTVKKVEH